MSLRDYLALIIRNWLIIALFAVLGAVGGYAYAMTQPVLYRAETGVVAVPARGDSASELAQGSNYVQSLVQTYAVMAVSPVVLEPVIDELGLPMSSTQLARALSVETPLDTAVLRITATSTDPAESARIADAVAAQLALSVAELSPQDASGEAAVEVTTISPATEPRGAASPNTQLLVLLGAGAGLAAGVVAVVARRLLATRVHSRADVTALTDLAVLGEIEQAGGGATLPAALRNAPNGPLAESIRSTVAGLRFADVDHKAKVLLVTSPSPGEGKSSVATSIALILAEQGSRVLLVDVDLRRGNIAELTQLEGSVGLTSVMLGDVALEQAAQRWASDRLHVLTSGPLPPNPAQLLASDQLQDLVARTRERYDAVILDAAPVLAVSDPLWLTRLADGVVVVARARATRRDALTRTVEEIEKGQRNVLGVVLNAVKRRSVNTYYGSTAPIQTREGVGAAEN